MSVKVLSLGGSIVAPEYPDTVFLKSFIAMLKDYLSERKEEKLILVVGGGGPARVYQKAYKEVAEESDEKSAAEAADWIGIAATRLNAQYVKACLGSLCKEDVVTNPTAQSVPIDDFDGRVLVAAGWKPGFSTDNDAVILAERFKAKTVVNLSNIEKVYTADPRENPDAQPLESISWKDFKSMVGSEWIPGKNCPFDPIASKRAAELNLTVICAAGKNIENTRRILEGAPYIGTSIKS